MSHLSQYDQQRRDGDTAMGHAIAQIQSPTCGADSREMLYYHRGVVAAISSYMMPCAEKTAEARALLNAAELKINREKQNAQSPQQPGRPD
jgi:hypothetical protein